MRKQKFEQLEPASFGWQRNGRYMPSPAEIAAECASIRNKWRPTEALKRAGWAFSARVTTLDVLLSEIVVG